MFQHQILQNNLKRNSQIAWICRKAHWLNIWVKLNRILHDPHWLKLRRIVSHRAAYLRSKMIMQPSSRFIKHQPPLLGSLLKRIDNYLNRNWTLSLFILIVLYKKKELRVAVGQLILSSKITPIYNSFKLQWKLPKCLTAQCFDKFIEKVIQQ